MSQERAPTTLIGANTSTALDLYHRLAVTPGNLFFSPYSISTALTMLSAGARGETLAEILNVIHATSGDDARHEAASTLDHALLEPRPLRPGFKGQPLALQIANSVWGQVGHHIEADFLELLVRAYRSPLNTVDFANDAPGAVEAINHWIDEHTNHKIRALLSELDPMTRLVLVNAVYFKAGWVQPFAEARTRGREFSTAAGTTVAVPFMHGKVSAGYASGDGWEAVDVAYLGDASMTVVVPDPGRFAEIERDLDRRGLTRIVGAFTRSEVDLGLPKLELSDRSNLVPVLQSLGMTEAFTNRADFSGITGEIDLVVDQAVHQATLTVDEQGTEAAAATAISARRISARPPGPTLIVDRPYLMLVRDGPTGTILFLGRITDPTQTKTQH